MLPPESADIADDPVITALQDWKILTGFKPPTGTAAHRQREWDGHCMDTKSVNHLAMHWTGHVS